jgi:alkylation response protein AidB-like acyl-CoA dehydrogenase
MSGSWDFKPLNELRLPRTVHDAVQRRIAHVSPEARKVPVLAAVEWRRFDFELLRSLSGRNEAELLGLVKQLIAALLVVEVEKRGDQFAFRHALTRQDVHRPESAVRGGFPVGDAAGYIQRNLANGLFHASASVGIAEVAHTTAIERLTRHVLPPEHMLIANNAIDLSAMRATFGRAAELVDAFHEAHLASDATSQDWTSIFAEVQAAKTFIGEAAQRIVARALTLSGGAGYTRSHALSRADRDVRASAFMQPIGALRAHDFLGRVSLGPGPVSLS